VVGKGAEGFNKLFGEDAGDAELSEDLTDGSQEWLRVDGSAFVGLPPSLGLGETSRGDGGIGDGRWGLRWA